MTGKQRAFLRSLAHTLDTVLFIGKEGITNGTVKEAYDLLEAREIIKCANGKSSPLTTREACQNLCEKTGAEPIQLIGRRFVVYRESRRHKQIDLKSIK